jgi:hypothetical protein
VSTFLTVLLAALETSQSTLDEDDEDLPPELIPALDTKLRAKLGVVQVCVLIPHVAITYIS